jgi:hypothetical protein
MKHSLSSHLVISQNSTANLSLISHDFGNILLNFSSNSASNYVLSTSIVCQSYPTMLSKYLIRFRIGCDKDYTEIILLDFPETRENIHLILV